MDMHHRRLPAPSDLHEVVSRLFIPQLARSAEQFGLPQPYLEELIKILNDGVMKVCRETYRHQHNSSIYKLEGWQINEGNLEYDGHAQGFDRKSATISGRAR